jgi:hypothetical protein
VGTAGPPTFGGSVTLGLVGLSVPPTFAGSFGFSVGVLFSGFLAVLLSFFFAFPCLVPRSTSLLRWP